MTFLLTHKQTVDHKMQDMELYVTECSYHLLEEFRNYCWDKDKNASYEKASETIEVDCKIQPFRIDDLKSKMEIAVAGVEGGVMSKRAGIVMVGIADDVEDEMKEIESDAIKASVLSTKNEPITGVDNNKKVE